jgi:hypothetical protein
MRKCNDEVYQLAKDQALDKKLKKQKIKAFLFMPSGCNVCNSRIQKIRLHTMMKFVGQAKYPSI